MSEIKCLHWGAAMVKGNTFDVKIFEKNIKQLKDENNSLKAQVEMLKQENKKLREREEKWRKCVEFYSHEKFREGYAQGYFMPGHRFDISCAACNEENKGRLARQTLKELDKVGSDV